MVIFISISTSVQQWEEFVQKLGFLTIFLEVCPVLLIILSLENPEFVMTKGKLCYLSNTNNRSQILTVKKTGTKKLTNLQGNKNEAVTWFTFSPQQFHTKFTFSFKQSSSNTGLDNLSTLLDPDSSRQISVYKQNQFLVVKDQAKEFKWFNDEQIWMTNNSKLKFIYKISTNLYRAMKWHLLFCYSLNILPTPKASLCAERKLINGCGESLLEKPNWNMSNSNGPMHMCVIFPDFEQFHFIATNPGIQTSS